MQYSHRNRQIERLLQITDRWAQITHTKNFFVVNEKWKLRKSRNEGRFEYQAQEKKEETKTEDGTQEKGVEKRLCML